LIRPVCFVGREKEGGFSFLFHYLFFWRKRLSFSTLAGGVAEERERVKIFLPLKE